MATRFAITSSNWSDTATWDNGALPVAGDNVYLNGYNVTLDQDVTAVSIRSTANSSILVANIATPAMTSNATPSGLANANTNASIAYYAFAQDGNTAAYWQSGLNTQTGWISYQFPTSKIIKRYTITVGTGATATPKDWTFQGSNDGSSWTILDTVSGSNVGANNTYVSTILANTTAYLYYRVNVTAGNSGTAGFYISEIQMTESTSSIAPGIAAGGTLIVTSSRTINANLFTTNANLLTFNVSDGSTLTISGSIAAPTAAQTAQTGTVIVRGNGNLNVTGNCTTSTNNAYGANSLFYNAVLFNSTGTFNLTGDVIALQSVGLYYAASAILINSGIVNINGNLYGSGAASGGMVGPTNSGALFIGGGVVTIIGNIYGYGNATYGGSSGLAVNGGTVNHTGSFIFSYSAGLPVIVMNGTYNYTGSATAGPANNAILATGNGIVNITGNVIASTGAAAVGSSSTGIITITGNITNNSNGTMAIYASRVNISSDSSQTWNMFVSGGTARNLLTPDQIIITGSYPSSSDVRSGVTYALTQTGSCIIPSASAVALGVPVDNTIGTAFLSITDIANAVWNVPVSNLVNTTGSMGALLSRASTVQTTAAQIAALTS